MNSHTLIKVLIIYLVILSNCVFANGAASVSIYSKDSDIIITRLGDDGEWIAGFRWRVYAGDDNCENPESAFPITIKAGEKKQVSFLIGYNHYCRYNVNLYGLDCSIKLAPAGDGDGAFAVENPSSCWYVNGDHWTSVKFDMTGNVAEIQYHEYAN